MWCYGVVVGGVGVIGVGVVVGIRSCCRIDGVADFCVIVGDINNDDAGVDSCVAVSFGVDAGVVVGDVVVDGYVVVVLVLRYWVDVRGVGVD